MKILSVAGFLGDNAGSLRILEIARLLQSRGHEVHLVQYVSKSTCDRVQGNKLDTGDISNSMVTVSRATVHIKHLRELAKDNYDLVYGNTHFGAFWSILGRLKGVPLIFDMHGGLVEEFLLNNQFDSRWKYSPRLFDYLSNRSIELMDLHFANKIICVSRKMVQYLHREKGIPLEKMAYVTNGVDLDSYKPVNSKCTQILKRQLGLENKFIFGYIGGFSKWQGVENFIEAAKRVDNPKLAFVIVGGKAESREGNLLFIPRVPRSQIANYYSICDVVVLPRPSHPATEIAAPTKFAEYTAMGKPILTTDVGDASDLVRKYDGGIVVKDNEVDNLVDGILQFEGKYKDELEIMGKNSMRLAANEFDWNKVADNLLKVIEETT